LSLEEADKDGIEQEAGEDNNENGFTVPAVFLKETGDHEHGGNQEEHHDQIP
jgi:hypothetical protein